MGVFAFFFRPTTSVRVVYIISLFLFISITLMTIIYIQARVFDGVRSYVRGEGLWAKAQKDAVLYLNRYSFSYQIEDYEAFKESVKVNLGDRHARLSMDKTPMDRPGAVQGFLAGQNAPEDIDSMIWFYQNFQEISYLKEAIRIWREADEGIASLIALSEEIRQKVRMNDISDIADLRDKISVINQRLFVLENNFSQVLGEGARWVKRTTLIASLCILFIFTAISIWISRQIIKNISQAEESLRISEARFTSLSQSNTIGIMSWNLNGDVLDANDYFLRMLGYTRKDLEIGRINWQRMTPPQWEEADRKAIEELLETGKCAPFEKELYDIYGTLVPVYLGASFVGHNQDSGIAFFMDLSQKKWQEEQLKLAAAVFDVSHDGIIITNDIFHIISVNSAITDILGFSNEELLDQEVPMLHSDPEKKRLIEQRLNDDGFWQGDMTEHTREGMDMPVHVSINSIYNAQNKVTHYVFIFFDITESKAREEQLKHLANHDVLTGLSNRAHLEKRLNKAIKKASQTEKHFALLFFDLDKFKPVNDTYGHEVGDKLLKIVANRLGTYVRKTDTVARLGGDEFIILLESLDNKERALQICEKTLKSLCAPTTIDKTDIEVSASVGVSIYPFDGEDAKTLLEKADMEMYRNKKHYS